MPSMENGIHRNYRSFTETLKKYSFTVVSMRNNNWRAFQEVHFQMQYNFLNVI